MICTPQKQLVLTNSNIHVWRVSLDIQASQIDASYRTLSIDEHKRAARYRLNKHRRYFIVARGVLRLLLSRYLGLAAEQIVFDYEKNGKPKLANVPTAKQIQFNLSHANELAVYAFAKERPVGIDIENLSNAIDFEPLAQRFFSTQETKTLMKVAKPLRKQAFLNCWTRKEAFVKATGEGLSRPLDQFDVSLVPGEPACLLRVASCQEEVLRWTMANLDVGPGYVGALVVKGDDWDLSCWDWPVTVL